jgi:hypothetical protein
MAGSGPSMATIDPFLAIKFTISLSEFPCVLAPTTATHCAVAAQSHTNFGTDPLQSTAHKAQKIQIFLLL